LTAAAFRKGGVRSAGLALALLLAVIVLPWGLNFVRLNPVTHRYTALLGVAPVYPLICIYAYQTANGKLKTVFGVFITFIIFTFALMNNAAGLATHLGNQRDLHMTSSILSSVKARAGNANIKRVYLAGSTAKDRRLPFALTTKGLMRSSAAQCGIYNCRQQHFRDAVLMIEPRSRVRYAPLLREAGFKKAIRHSDARSSSVLRDGFRKARPWPDFRSIVIDVKTGAAFIFLDQKSINTIQNLLSDETAWGNLEGAKAKPKGKKAKRKRRSRRLNILPGQPVEIRF
jgi:hypothetical protein